MTIFAGVVALTPDAPIPDELCGELQRLVSRDPDATVNSIRKPRCFVAHVDIGAFRVPGTYTAEDGSTCIIVGDPVLEMNAGTALGRDQSARILHMEWLNGDENSLCETRAQFAIFNCDGSGARVSLATDRIAIRPVFYWNNDEFVVFATALRILEACSAVAKILSIQGVTERAGFGYSLSNRTPYSGIYRLRAGEALDIMAGRLETRRYWRWDRATIHSGTVEDLTARTYEVFRSGIRARLDSDRTALAFLSGGLDSRCNVAVLRDLGTRVYTFDFSLPGRQDENFAQSAAKALGSIHTPDTIDGSVLKERDKWSFLMAESSKRLFDGLPAADLPERPRTAWSGEGGSFTVGYVHLHRETFDLARAGDWDGAIRTYLNEVVTLPPRRLLKPEILDSCKRIPAVTMHEELSKIECDDPARKFYIFYLTTEQSQLMSAHFESIDLHKLEQHAPFCDTELIECILSLPVDLGLGHKFYHAWLNLFPAAAASVPWQTYPGHEKCPRPTTMHIPSQWENIPSRLGFESSPELKNMAKSLFFSRWPRNIIEKKIAFYYFIVHLAGFGNYAHAFDAVQTYVRFFENSQGFSLTN